MLCSVSSSRSKMTSCVLQVQSGVMRSVIRCITITLRCLCECGKVELGERMALQVFAATRTTEPGREGSRTTICGWESELAEQDSRVSRAEKDLHTMSSTAKSKRESKHDAILSGEPYTDGAAAADHGLPSPPSSREEDKVPQGRRPQEKTHNIPLAHSSCSGSAGDGGATRTGATGSSIVRSGADYQRPDVGNAAPDPFDGGESPCKADVKTPSNPRRGFANPISSEVWHVLG